MPVLFRDYETRSTINLANVGAWIYATHSATEIWCCAYAVDDDGPIQLWTPGDPVPPEFTEAAQNPDWLICAFNDQFERLIEQHIMGPRYGWSGVPIERHRCLQASALALALPAKLESVAAALDLQQQKDTAGRKLMLKLARLGADENPTPEQLTRLYEYCRQDIATERDLYERIGFLSAAEQALWQLDATINDRGIYIDGALLDSAIKVATAASADINAELQAVTNGIVSTVNQVAELIAWLSTHDCAIPDLQKSTLRQALTRKQLLPEARRAIELRLDGAHAATAKLATMKAWRNGDGRARGFLRFHGASTGRWSSHGIQLQNMKRPIVANMAEAIAVVGTGDLAQLRGKYSQPMSVIGDITRALICAQPGHRFIAADLSGIESRLTAWLSGQQSKIEQWAKFDRTHESKDEPYFIIGRACGQPDETARAIGKTADLAFGYMGGPGAWRKLASDDTSSDEDIKKRQQTWRNSHSHTVRFWGELNRAAIKAVRNPGTAQQVKRLSFTCENSFLKMSLPSGRVLSYPFPKLKINERGDYSVVFMDNMLGKWIECRHGQGAYGGTWIENAVQAVARDLFAAAMPRLETAKYKIVLHVHDEIVAEVADDFGSAEEFLQILITPPSWADGLPIAAKVRNGPRFCKMSSEPEAVETVMHEPDRGSDPFEKTNQRPFVEVEPEADNHAGVENPQNSEDSARRFHGNGQAHDDDAGQQQQQINTDPELGPYIYQTARGAPHAKVIRTPNGRSRFTQKHWDGTAWQPEMPTHKLPYRLPELLAADPESWVCITEGEKDAVNVAKLGFVATTNPNGANGWKSAKLIPYFAHLKRIAILEDNDAAGRERTKRIRKTLRILDPAPDIREVAFPELPEKSDVSDWLKQDKSRDYAALLALITAAPSNRSTRRALATEVLKTMTFAPIKYVVPGVIVEGLTLLAGKPKIGKSWLLLHAGIAVASGGCTLGDLKCEEGDVLYCALEDNLRRLQSRMQILRPDEPWPARMYVETEMPRLGDGGLDYIRSWLNSVKHPRLIIIDTLAMVRARKEHDQSQYDADYNAILELRTLAAERGVAIVVSHHLRKMDSDDAFDTVSGTLGLTGAVDSILVLKRDQSGAVILYGRGRDLVEIEKAMAFDKIGCTWAITGEVMEAKQSAAREKILDALIEIGEPASPSEIAAVAHARVDNVKHLLRKLVEAGIVCKPEPGKYAVAVAGK